MISSTLDNKLEVLFSDVIKRKSSVGGGCIANAQKVEFQSGYKVFVKSGFVGRMFVKEANGLKELAKSNAFRIPKVLEVDDDFLVLEYIETGAKDAEFFKHFGRQLAYLHRFTTDEFGFFEDNYIGSSQQSNIPSIKGKTDWATFYLENRLLYQFKMAEKKGYVDAGFRTDFKKLEGKIPHILKHSEELPTLMHGDLWGGNYMTDQNGKPVLIDPAVYYGHRELDLAMTYIFGGFYPDFYEAYQKENPLKEGWEFRLNLYKLYHILNHLNIFGMGYYREAQTLIQYYTHS